MGVQKKKEINSGRVASSLRTSIDKDFLSRQIGRLDLISGLYSPVYIQLRPLLSYPAAFKTVCGAMAELIANETPEINRVIGLAMAAFPSRRGSP